MSLKTLSPEVEKKLLNKRGVYTKRIHELTDRFEAQEVGVLTFIYFSL